MPWSEPETKEPTVTNDPMGEYRSLIRRGWEMELLISGFLTFALLQVPALIDLFTAFIYVEGYTLLSISNDLVSMVFVKGLSLMLALHFLLHIVVRTFWIAFIGLEFTFPGGPTLPKYVCPKCAGRRPVISATVLHIFQSDEPTMVWALFHGISDLLAGSGRVEYRHQYRPATQSTYRAQL